jgi:hypothetical protein
MLRIVFYVEHCGLKSLMDITIDVVDSGHSKAAICRVFIPFTISFRCVVCTSETLKFLITVESSKGE